MWWLEGWFAKDLGVGRFMIGESAFGSFIVDLEYDILFGFVLDEWCEFGHGGTKNGGLPLLIKLLIIRIYYLLGYRVCDWLFGIHCGLARYEVIKY